MASGYCTVDDVRRALQEASLDGALGEDDNQAVVDAIASQSEWLQETTNRHWYEPDGVDGDTQGVVYSEPLEHSETLDLPSTPHADHTQVFRGGGRNRQPRYPKRFAGPHTRVRLTRRDVQDIDELLVRDTSGDWADWTDEKTEGRGEDYYVTQPTDTGFARLYLDTGALPRLRNYSAAVSPTYTYGIDHLSDTVRRAVALRATAQLVLDDDAQVGIPDQGQLVQLESKAQAMERQAEELLEIHL